MNKKLLMMAIIAIVMTTMPSCSPRMTVGGTAAAEIVDSYTGSVNDVNLEISSEPITYSIDISTAEGRAKLHKLTLPRSKKPCPARSSYDEQKVRKSSIHNTHS